MKDSYLLLTDHDWRHLMERSCDRSCRMTCSYFGVVTADDGSETRCPLLVSKAKEIMAEVERKLNSGDAAVETERKTEDA